MKKLSGIIVIEPVLPYLNNTRNMNNLTVQIGVDKMNKSHGE